MTNHNSVFLAFINFFVNLSQLISDIFSAGKSPPKGGKRTRGWICETKEVLVPPSGPTCFLSGWRRPNIGSLLITLPKPTTSGHHLTTSKNINNIFAANLITDGIRLRGLQVSGTGFQLRGLRQGLHRQQRIFWCGRRRDILNWLFSFFHWMAFTVLNRTVNISHGGRASSKIQFDWDLHKLAHGLFRHLPITNIIIKIKKRLPHCVEENKCSKQLRHLGVVANYERALEWWYHHPDKPEMIMRYDQFFSRLLWPHAILK